MTPNACLGRSLICTCALVALAPFAAPRAAVAQLTWTIVDDTTNVGTRSARGIALSDDESELYVGLIQGSSTAGARRYTLAGDPPVGMDVGFFNVTTAPGGSSGSHQAEATATDDRGFVYVASIKDSTSVDNARVYILDGTLATNTQFVLADITPPPTNVTGETIGDLAFRRDGAALQLYVTRFDDVTSFVERYVIGGTGVGDATLTLDTTFNGTGQYAVPSASNLRGIDVGSDGTMFIASRENDTVYRVSADLTTVSTQAVTRAMDVALFGTNAYVTQYDGTSSAIVELRQSDLVPTGNVYTAAGTFVPGAGTGYSGIDIDAAGRIYICDQIYATNSDRILVSSPLPTSLVYDGNVTPDVIFGSGNANGGFTIDRQNSVELGMRGKLRNPPMNIFNSNGDGTYTFNTGSGTASFPQSEWTMEWAVNSDYDDLSGAVLSDLTYEIGMDNDPGTGTDFLVFNHINPGFAIPYTPPSLPVPAWDHAMGDNTTPNGGGVSTTDPVMYAANLATFNVAQNSWKPTFFQNTAPYSWDPDVPGLYDYYMKAYDGGVEVASTKITIIAVDGTTLSLEADPCQTDVDPGKVGTQVEVELWLRNPDDVDVTGWVAFLEFDSGSLTYEGGCSSYSSGPFTSHLRAIDDADETPTVPAGELWLDGNTFPSPIGTTGDELLATLVFTIGAECVPTTDPAVGFVAAPAFESKVSFGGVPIPTSLLPSGPIVVDDGDPPMFTFCPTSFSQAADAGIGGGCLGAIVTWADPTATDTCSDVSIVCTPASGSFFPVGTTAVECVATDACGNSSTCTFNVTVDPENVICVDIQLNVGSPAISAMRCIRFELNGCAMTLDIPLMFDSAGVFDGEITVPCGVYSAICAKDEQHTQWANADLVVSADLSKYELSLSTPVLDLLAGDTDNDGDVDIDDVTLLLAQFGLVEPAGGCPWNGMRGADFDNNGAVGSSDYTILAPQWLTMSDCVPCPVPFMASKPEGKPVPRMSIPTTQLDWGVAQKVDLNKDGMVDHRDVRAFEIREGLPDTLSTSMLLGDLQYRRDQQRRRGR